MPKTHAAPTTEPILRSFDVTVSGRINVPQDWEPLPNSAGWRLPNGREVKIWFAIELSDQTGEKFRDLNANQAERIGMSQFDYDRHEMEEAITQSPENA